LLPLLTPLLLLQAPAPPLILPLRERAALRDRWTARRLETVAPRLMRREGISMWILDSREYNEDPVFPTMAPATWMSARRRTLLVFFDPGGDEPVERLAVSRYPIGDFFQAAWDPAAQPDPWTRLAELVRARDPATIALDFSSTFALADGISSSERRALEAALGEPWKSRIVSAEKLAVGWLETRIPEELEVYPRLCRIAHRIIAEGFSEQVIQPGVTTTEDLQWWFRERIEALHLDTWFHPSVSLQRFAGREQSFTEAFLTEEAVIHPGDLLHVDFGITYLGLNTDTQEHAYVLRPGETAAPAGLQAALKTGNRLQDTLMREFGTGRTGNELLKSALERARAAGIEATIYSHPLGFHGHGAGPFIGLWDHQEGVPGRGDAELHPDTVFSIELQARVPVEEWGGRKVRIMLEEDAWFDGKAMHFLDGRQTDLLLVP